MGRKGDGWRWAALLLAVAALAFAFWYGGNAPGLHGWSVTPSPSPRTAPVPSTAVQDVVAPPSLSASALPSEQAEEAPTPSSTPASAQPAAVPLPAEPSPGGEMEPAESCTVSIRCDTILAHMDALAEEKRELVPGDGVILAPTTVTFEPGESAFDVLRRVCRDQGIHMEFTTTPVYNSAYIEGIQNLYEFDCGELSGWMYRVNGQYLSYGASAYSLQDGDVVEWHYTCQQGQDLPEGLVTEE